MTSLVLMIVAGNALSHGRWVIPSHTVLSGDKPETVTFDFSITNDVFHPDNGYGGIPLKQLEKLFPAEKGLTSKDFEISTKQLWTKLKVSKRDGTVDTRSPVINLGRKSVSAYKMESNGTYRIEIAHKPIHYVTYRNKENKRSRQFGRLTQIREQLPKGASKIVATKLTNRVQTYVTRNEVTEDNLKPGTEGLDIIFDNHPNELFKGESTVVQLYLHGKPLLESATIKVTQGGTRYRNQRNSQTYHTNQKGNAVIEWTQPGLILVEVELEKAANHEDYTQDKYALHVTLEVSQE